MEPRQVTQQDLAFFQKNWGTLPPNIKEEVASLRDALVRKQEAEAELRTKNALLTESRFLDPPDKYLEALDPRQAQAAKKLREYRTPEDQILADNRAVQSAYGDPPESYGATRNATAKALFGAEGGVTDQQFHDLAKQHYQKTREARAGAASAIEGAAAAAFLKLDPDETFAAWAKDNLPKGQDRKSVV